MSLSWSSRAANKNADFVAKFALAAKKDLNFVNCLLVDLLFPLFFCLYLFIIIVSEHDDASSLL